AASARWTSNITSTSGPVRPRRRRPPTRGSSSSRSELLHPPVLLHEVLVVDEDGVDPRSAADLVTLGLEQLDDRFFELPEVVRGLDADDARPILVEVERLENREVVAFG